MKAEPIPKVRCAVCRLEKEPYCFSPSQLRSDKHCRNCVKIATTRRIAGSKPVLQ